MPPSDKPLVQQFGCVIGSFLVICRKLKIFITFGKDFINAAFLMGDMVVALLKDAERMRARDYDGHGSTLLGEVTARSDFVC